MPLPKILTFVNALAATETGKRHLLLGNGFSIALFPDRFQYGSLLEQADFSAYPEAREAFNTLSTTDFEVVIKALRDAVTVLPLYAGDPALCKRMKAHADALKELLVQVIAGRHPARPSDITEKQYAACRMFLSHFIGESRNRGKGEDYRGKLYTVSYDLLTYWTILHDEVKSQDASGKTVRRKTEPLSHGDGFRESDSEPDAPYVTWEAEGAADGQTVHFLHGALHFFDDGPE